MSKLKVIKSEIDDSVNFVKPVIGGFIESRYVRRADHYIIGYLSSQTGCNRGCKMCHLTTSGQTTAEDLDGRDYLDQAQKILLYYHSKGECPARIVNWNFMARGEPFANDIFLGNAPKILSGLAKLSRIYKLKSRFNVSTIVPRTLKKNLVDVFGNIHPTIYCSMYSINDGFRKKWLPGAMPVNQALCQLKEYQELTGKIIKIHHPLIAGENDSVANAYAIASCLNSMGLRWDFNLVRYNPASENEGVEADKYMRSDYLNIIHEQNPYGQVQEVTRVGEDCYASCGMFYSGEEF